MSRTLSKFVSWMQTTVILPFSESQTGGSVGKVNPVAARWLMWVDGVGGFLMLPGDDWTIGGPSGGEESEICIQGDLSAREACLRRAAGDYVLQPFAAALLGGRRLQRPTLLRDGDCITLGLRALPPRSLPEELPNRPGVGRPGVGLGGGGVRLRFATPHPLSCSARLSLDSRHRVRPRCDAIILLADTCVLGPSTSSHIVAVDADSEVVLLFSGGRWWCRSEGETLLDGRAQRGRVEVVPGVRVESGGLAFSLEAL